MVARTLHEDAPLRERLVSCEGTARGQGLFDPPHGEALRAELSGLVEAVFER